MFFALRRVYAASAKGRVLNRMVLLISTLVVDSLVNLMAFLLTRRLV